MAAAGTPSVEEKIQKVEGEREELKNEIKELTNEIKELKNEIKELKKKDGRVLLLDCTRKGSSKAQRSIPTAALGAAVVPVACRRCNAILGSGLSSICVVAGTRTTPSTTRPRRSWLRPRRSWLRPRTL
jgi:NMD protein affecting ribosome stability and mRNA decay